MPSTRLLAVAALLVCSTAAAQLEAPEPGTTAPVVDPTGDAPHRDGFPGRGVWTNDEYRYGQRWNVPIGLLLRTLMDLVSIPSGLVAWDARDWGTAAAVVGTTVALSIPIEGTQTDVRIQRNVQAALGGLDHYRLWTPYGDFIIWTTIYAGLFSTLLYGLTQGNSAFVEAPVLAMEAFLVMQVFHWSIKALAGRDGPEENRPPTELSSNGIYRGPAGFTSPFGSGTPSGHAGSLYAIVSALTTYFDSPALTIALNIFAGLFCLTIIADNYHFLSEVVLGAALGACVGRWVVEHRSSRYRNDVGDGLPRRVWALVLQHATLAPAVMPGGGLGGAVMVRF